MNCLICFAVILIHATTSTSELVGQSSLKAPLTSLRRDDTHVAPRDIVKIKILKPQSDPELRRRASIMNNSFGIVIEHQGNVSRPNTQNLTEYLIKSSSELKQNIKLGIKPKYLERIAELHIHDVSGHNLSYMADTVDRLTQSEMVIMHMLPSASNKQMHYIYQLGTDGLPRSAAFMFQCKNAFIKLSQLLAVAQVGDIINFLSELHLHCDARWVSKLLGITLSLEDISTRITPVQQRFIRNVSSAITQNSKRIASLNFWQFDDRAIQHLKDHNKKHVLNTFGDLWRQEEERQPCAIISQRVAMVADCELGAMMNSSLFNVPKRLQNWKTMVLSTVLDMYFTRFTDQKRDLCIVTDNVEILGNLETLLAGHIYKTWKVNNFQLSNANALAKRIVKKHYH